jgi:D-3-phosphoglycerate dehydrogenase
VERCTTLEDALHEADVVTLHLNLDDTTRSLINKTRIAAMKKGAIVINTARGGLIVEQDVAEACQSGQLGGYGGDVLEHEPMVAPHPFMEIDNIIITPHVGSRTFESVERQAMRATLNIVNYLNGEKDFIQANKF